MLKLLKNSFIMAVFLLSTSIVPLSLGSVGYSYSYGTSDVVAKDVYSLRLSLKVPQVTGNTESKGVRKVQRQQINGNLNILWMKDGSCSFETEGLVNRNFKVGGKNVTYEGYAGDEIVFPRFSYIGSNLTGKFSTPTISFSLVLEPSYAMEEVNEDNSFYLVLSGFGASSVRNGSRIATRFSGNVAGSQGCGCTDYGHKSPTRIASVDGASEYVTDVVATYGTWTMSFKKRVVQE